MIEPLRFSEALEYGGQGYKIRCDTCRWIIDVITDSFWINAVDTGVLYAGALCCWRCLARQRRHNTEEAVCVVKISPTPS